MIDINALATAIVNKLKGSSDDHYYSFVDNLSVLDPEGLNLGGRTLVTVRDGVLEYMGFEVGLTGDAATDMIPVYRTRETIEKLAPALIGIPIVEGGHLDTNYPVPPHVIVGYTRTAILIDIEDPATETTCAVAQEAEMIKSIPGLPELSLGYKAKIRPFRDGFEQYDIIPHHHAAVEAGRCGGICSFKDHKIQENTMLKDLLKKKQAQQQSKGGKPKQFHDDETPSLEAIAATIGNFAEAVKTVPLDENVLTVIAAMQAVIDGAGSSGDGTPPDGGEAAGEGNPPAGEQKQQDADPKPDDKGSGGEGESEKEEKPFADEKQFLDAVQKATQKEVQRYVKVCSKAAHFLPENYDYTSKAPEQIMRDTLKSQGYKEFGDAKCDTTRLEVAFDLLRIDSDYKTFGDKEGDPLDAVKTKEI